MPQPDRPVRQRPSAIPGPLETASLFWRWLRRMRTALYLLGGLGAATLLATVVPQEPNVPETVENWLEGTEGPGPTISRFLETVGAFDVYGSPWFTAIVVLLFTSLTACLIPRIRAFVRTWRYGQPPRARSFSAKPKRAYLTTSQDPDEARAAAREVLSGRRFRLRREEDAAEESTPMRADARGVVVPAPADAGDTTDGAGGGDQGVGAVGRSGAGVGARRPQVAAEKGHLLREGGSLAFHLAFYVILIGVVLGQLLVFRGQIGVVEGESFADTPVSYWANASGRWWQEEWHRDWVLTLDSFEVEWTETGMPVSFISHVTVEFPDGRPERVADLRVNDPLVVDDMKIHQLDWGWAVRMVVTEDDEVVYDRHVVLTANDDGYWEGAVKAPAADPQLGLDLVFFATAPDDEDGRPVPTVWPAPDAPLLLFHAYEGDLDMDRVQGVNDLETAGMERLTTTGLRPGFEVEVRPGTTVSFSELSRWSGFQVSQRPTDPVLLVGSVLIIAALFPALYAYRRRVWVEAERDPATGVTRVTLAGHAFQRPQAFDGEFDAIVAALSERLAAEPSPDPDVPADRPEVVQR
jgi:cytochrome c biogenesis protein